MSSPHHIVHRRKCFVSTEDSQTLRSFVRAASSSHPNLQYAKISDTVWGLHILTMSKAYAQSVDYRVKTMVSNVGRQPKSNVWVFSDSLQIDGMGQIILPEDQTFYW